MTDWKGCLIHPENPPDPAVEVHDVRVMRGERALLDGVSCRLPRGACTALLGPNGCGKTTFARTLTGHLFPTAGTVRVLGQALGETDIRDLRRRIGVVNPAADSGLSHQAGAVVDLNLPAVDAVLTGLFGTVWLYDPVSEAQRQWAGHLLEEVGLAHRRQDRLSLLSTGERRRVLMARAMIHLPELLILDEPTAGLDIAGRERMLATVERVLAGGNPPTVLIITHHVEELTPRTQQVLLMREGRIIARGTPDGVITSGQLSETFGCPVHVHAMAGRYWLEVPPAAWEDLIE